MEKVDINKECSIAYTVLALHTIFNSGNREITVEDLVKEIRAMFEIYTNEERVMKRMDEILKLEGKNKIAIKTGM